MSAPPHPPPLHFVKNIEKKKSEEAGTRWQFFHSLQTPVPVLLWMWWFNELPYASWVLFLNCCVGSGLFSTGTYGMALRSADKHDWTLGGPCRCGLGRHQKVGVSGVSGGRGGMDRPVSASLGYCGFCRCWQLAASVSCKKGEWEAVCGGPVRGGKGAESRPQWRRGME